jgi:hypothetical protein
VGTIAAGTPMASPWPGLKASYTYGTTVTGASGPIEFHEEPNASRHKTEVAGHLGPREESERVVRGRYRVTLRQADESARAGNGRIEDDKRQSCQRSQDAMIVVQPLCLAPNRSCPEDVGVMRSLAELVQPHEECFDETPGINIAHSGGWC